MSGALQAWLLAARPKTLPAAVVPVWAGCVLVFGVTGRYDLGLALATLAGAVCIQIATNFFNDAIDAGKGADTEARLGPERVTASGRMSPRAAMLVGAFFLLLACLAAVPLIQARGWVMVAIGVPSLFLAYGYTGGPFPLAYLGLGELFVLLFFGLVAVAGTVFVQTGEWWGSALMLGAVVGCLSGVLITINNLRDVDEDRSSGKRTLAVRWGWERARWLVAAEVLGAVGILFLLTRSLGLGMSVSLGVLLGLVGLGGGVLAWQAFRLRPSERYNGLLKGAGLLLIAFGLGWHWLMVG